jgi:hypothetical protein
MAQDRRLRGSRYPEYPAFSRVDSCLGSASRSSINPKTQLKINIPASTIFKLRSRTLEDGATLGAKS